MNTGATDIQTSLENSVKNEIQPAQQNPNAKRQNINPIKNGWNEGCTQFFPNSAV